MTMLSSRIITTESKCGIGGRDATYYVYNMKELKENGFVANKFIPMIFAYCGFCKNYTWHYPAQHRYTEVAVCDTCNNALTSQLIRIFE